MGIEIGRNGSLYKCNIDGNTYQVTGKHTAVRVTDPGAIQDAKNTFISNWREFHVEGGSPHTPAGATPGPKANVHLAGANSAPPVTGSGNQFTRNELIQHLMAKGFTKAGAIGIVANLEAENGLKTTGPAGSQGEHGLAQWKGPRLENLKAYSAAHNLDWQGKQAQLGFLLEELANKYPATYARVKNATDPRQAAQDFCAGFEQPTLDNGTPNYQTYEVRKRLAAQIAAGG